MADEERELFEADQVKDDEDVDNEQVNGAHNPAEEN